MLLSEYLSNDRIPRARSHEMLANDLEQEDNGIADQHIVTRTYWVLFKFDSFFGSRIHRLANKSTIIQQVPNWTAWHWIQLLDIVSWFRQIFWISLWHLNRHTTLSKKSNVNLGYRNQAPLVVNHFFRLSSGQSPIYSLLVDLLVYRYIPDMEEAVIQQFHECVNGKHHKFS